MCTSPPSKSTHSPSFNASMGQVVGAEGGGGQGGFVTGGVTMGGGTMMGGLIIGGFVTGGFVLEPNQEIDALTRVNLYKRMEARKEEKKKNPTNKVPAKHSNEKNKRQKQQTERERALSALEARWGLFPAHVQQPA
ncbi:hypothetical protein CKAN_00931400 [Cinnamomum micranthum f. kanehirae]|uniref:Uncharacterized protein n=1 Tax=Cinnamomum micranthum f. kanehirae TaxID=337451 RepID=A0A3S3MBS8_9MAGN|nr:hypothetical protein CKAN_00931400 [Cinnamomum micranthum f. kanehirae]